MNTQEPHTVLSHLPLVRRIALRMLKHMPSNVLLEDLIQSGTLGLLDALGRYNDQEETPIEHYAGIRIQGAMLDSLRDADHLPRKWRRAQRQMAAAIAREEQRLGRPPRAVELASALEMPLPEYYAFALEESQGQLVSLDDVLLDEQIAIKLCDNSADPARIHAQMDFRREVWNAIEALPPRERKALTLYYDRELTLKECGARLGVTESMACLLHRQAIQRLRATLSIPVATRTKAAHKNEKAPA